MLILSRRQNESVVIDCHGERIEIVVYRLNPGDVRLGFDAPLHCKILRSELQDREEVIDGVLPAHDGPESRQ